MPDDSVDCGNRAEQYRTTRRGEAEVIRTLRLLAPPHSPGECKTDYQQSTIGAFHVGMAVVHAGHPVLHRVAEPLSLRQIRSEPTQRLIGSMRRLMRASSGVGVAAPQVGRPIQLFVVEIRAESFAGISQAELDARGWEPSPFRVFINPKVRPMKGDEPVWFEACFSVPGFRALVPRRYAVQVHALDDGGHPFSLMARGWLARVIQHEYDHLRGLLYVDRMLPRSLTTQENYDKLWKGRPIRDVHLELRVIDIHQVGGRASPSRGRRNS